MSAESARPHARARRWRWLLWCLFPLAAWLLFNLFRPALVWSSGWQPLPSGDSASGALVQRADPAWAAVAAKANAQLRESRARLQAPALSAAIMIDGKRVWAGAVGSADLASSRPVRLDSRFRLGSSSKAINALLLGTMMDAGRIDIERKVRDYLPELPAAYQEVTTRQAVSHTAGVPDYGLCLCFPIWEHLNRRHFDSVRGALRVFDQRPLLFKPGTGFAYSSYGANLVGAELSAISHEPYLALVQQAVFAPLQMHDSRGDVAGAVDPLRVSFYEVTEGKYKLAEPVDNSIRYPSGGLLSTPSDMLAAGQAFIDDRLLSEATRKRLLTRQALADGSENPQGYALGIRVFDDKMLFNDKLKARFYSHHGTAVGSTSYFAIYPDYGLVVSVMMNKGQDNLDALGPEANHIVELFLAERLRREGTPLP